MTQKLIPPITLNNIDELKDTLTLMDELMYQEQQNTYSNNTEYLKSINKLIDDLQFELRVIEQDLLEEHLKAEQKKNRILPKNQLMFSQENIHKALGYLKNKDMLLITNQEEFMSDKKQSSDYKFTLRIEDIDIKTKIFIEIEKKGIFYFAFNPYNLDTVTIDNSLISHNGQIIRKEQKLKILTSKEEYNII